MTDIKNSPYLDRPIRTLEQAQADMARSVRSTEPQYFAVDSRLKNGNRVGYVIETTEIKIDEHKGTSAVGFVGCGRNLQEAIKRAGMMERGEPGAYGPLR